MPTDLPECIVTADYAPLPEARFSRSVLARENPFSRPIVAETEFVITLDGHFSYYLPSLLLAAQNGHGGMSVWCQERKGPCGPPQAERVAPRSAPYGRAA
jgi:hypothetical protein